MRSSSLFRNLRDRLVPASLTQTSPRRRLTSVVASGVVALLLGSGLAVAGVSAAQADDTTSSTSSTTTGTTTGDTNTDTTTGSTTTGGTGSDAPDPTPTDTPAPAPADTSDPAAAVVPAVTTVPATSKYVIAAWSEDNWGDSNEPAKWGPYWFPQTLVTSLKTDSTDLSQLDSHLTCGTYQVDMYLNSADTDLLLAGGILHPTNGSYEDFVVSNNSDWKIFSINSGCTPDVSVAPTTCTTFNGSASPVAVTATKLVENRTYTVVVKNGPTTIDTVTNVSGASGSWTKSYTVPAGDSLTATVTDNAGVTNYPDVRYSASASATAISCQEYHIVVWSEDNWKPGEAYEAQSPDWYPQSYVADVKSTTLNLDVLDSHLTCGAYQVDAYADDATTDALIAGAHLTAPNSPPESWPNGVYEDGTWGGVYNSSFSKIIAVTSGCTPTLAVTPQTCSTVNGTSSPVLVSATDLVAGVKYSVKVEDTTSDATQTATVVGDAEGGWSDTYVEPTGDSVTVTIAPVLGGSDQTTYATSKTVTASSCPGVAASGISIDPCTTVGGTGSVQLTGDFTPGETYTVAIAVGSAAAVDTQVIAAADGSLTAPVPGGSSFTATIYDADGVQLGDAQSGSLDACPEVAATSITAVGGTGVAALATTGVDPIGPAMIALVALQLGLALLAVSIIRRRRPMGD